MPRPFLVFVCLLGFTSCRFFANPVSNTVPEYALSPTQDASGRLLFANGSSVERYSHRNGVIRFEQRWGLGIGSIVSLDASERSNEVWAYGRERNEPFDKVIRVSLPAGSAARRTAAVNLLDSASLVIRDIAAGPGDTLYIVGTRRIESTWDPVHEEVVARCTVRGDTCGSFFFQTTRSDTRRPLVWPSAIDVDMQTGDIYVLEGRDTPTEILSYSPSLERTGLPAIRVDGQMYNIAADDGFVVACATMSGRRTMGSGIGTRTL
jgi:hypothetical protein